MRLVEPLRKELYRFESTVRFKPLRDLKLKNELSGQGIKVTSQHCVQEMFNMISCLKQREFNQSECTNEIEIFRKCNKIGIVASPFPRTKPKPGAVKTANMQLNELLKKHPQP